MPIRMDAHYEVHRMPTDPADTLHLARWTVTSGSNVRSRGAVVITSVLASAWPARAMPSARRFQWWFRS